MNRELRGYQSEALESLRAAIVEGERRIVLQLPTGGGKTVIAAGIVDGALRKGRRVLFTVPAVSLVDQTVQSFWDEGFRDIGVIQAQHSMTDWSKPVQVASVQTLQRRTGLPQADVMVVDECHRMFSFYSDVFTLPEWVAKPIIGLSATPWSRGLGVLYKRLIIAASTADLIASGHLAPFRVFAPAHPDLSGVRTLAGDYHEGDLAGAMNTSPLVADIVSTWQRTGEGRSTFCFAVDCAHAKSLQERFEAAGVTAGYIDADTPLVERDRIRDRFQEGDIRVVCNVGCLTTGIDWDVRCIILARPTKSEMLFVQMIGRGLRTADGKEDCLVLDHSDTTLRLGFVTDIHHDKLDDGRERLKATNENAVRLPKECPQCSYLKPPRLPVCPACGHKAEHHAAMVEVKDGELVEVAGKRSKGKDGPPEDRAAFYGQLKGYAIERSYAIGWANHKYREKFGTWPNGYKEVPPAEPTLKMRSWIKSRQIAWAKARANAGAGGADANV